MNKKKIFSVRVNEEQLEKLRDIVHITPGVTLSSLIEDMITQFIVEHGEVESRNNKKLTPGRKL